MARVLVEDGHKLDLAAIFARVEEEVHTPDVVRVARLQTQAAAFARAQAAALALLLGHLQPGLLPETVHALAVDAPALTAQELRDHAVAGTWILLGQFV